MDTLDAIILSDPIVILAEHGYFVDNSNSNSCTTTSQTSINRSDATTASLLHSMVCKKKYSIKRW